MRGMALHPIAAVHADSDCDITNCRGIQHAEDIDKINILQATYRAMEAAVAGLPEASKPSAVLVDGNRTPPNIKAKHVETIVKGDGKVFSIAAASIIAKVTRDRIMHESHEKWPEYGFAQHKGYGTKAHMAAVRELGPCPIHRCAAGLVLASWCVPWWFPAVMCLFCFAL